MLKIGQRWKRKRPKFDSGCSEYIIEIVEIINSTTAKIMFVDSGGNDFYYKHGTFDTAIGLPSINNMNDSWVYLEGQDKPEE